MAAASGGPAATLQLVWSPVGPFDEDQSIGDRWPNSRSQSTRNNLVMQHIWGTYVTHRSLTVPWFSGGHRTLYRSRHNQRDVGDAGDEMTESLLTHGVLVMYRGRPLLQETGSPERWDVVGAGTLVDNWYVAHARAPDNPFIAASLAVGLEDCTVLHARTPADVVKLLTQEHNSFHKGAPTTWLQVFLWAVLNCVQIIVV